MSTMGERDYKKRIQGNFTYLLKELEGDVLAEHMYQAEMFDSDDEEKVSSGNTRKEKNKKFLRILSHSKHGQKAYDKFTDTLKNQGYPHIAQKLEDYDPNKCTPNEAQESSISMDLSENFDRLQTQIWSQANMFMKLKEEINQIKESQKTPSDDADAIQSEKFNHLKQSWESLMPNIQDYVTDVIKQELVERKAVDKEAELATDDAGTSIDGATQAGTHTSKESGAKMLERMISKKGGKHEHVDEIVQAMSADVAVDIVNYMSALEPSDKEDTPNQYKSTMRRLVNELIDQQSSFFTSMIERLELKDLDGLETISHVTDEMFRLGETHWGKIIALYSFIGWIAKHVTEQVEGKEGMTRDKLLEFRKGLGDYLGFYMRTKLGRWIQANGGWDSFLTKFPEKGSESDSSMKTVLFTTIGVATILALVAGTRT